MTRLARHLLTPWALLSLLTLLAVSSVTLAISVLSSLRWVANVSAWEVAQWMLLQLPGTLVLVLPLALLLASALVVAQHHEGSTLVAVAAGGVAPWRVLWPWLGVLLVGSAFSFALSEFVRPRAEQVASVRWWSLTTDRSPAHRLQGRDLKLPDGVEWRFERYDDASDRLLEVRVVRAHAGVSDIWMAREGFWSDSELTLQGVKRIRLDLDALDGDGEGALVWSEEAGPTILKLAETRLETQARYSLGTIGDGRSWSRHWLLARDAAASAVERGSSERRSAEILVSALGVTLAVGVALLWMLRSGRGRPLLLLVGAGLGLGWSALAAIGSSLAITGALPPAWGPWLPVAPALLLGAWLWRGRSLW
jgi:lipopolysaccharide export LptBFGC system permease protein LptF